MTKNPNKFINLLNDYLDSRVSENRFSGSILVAKEFKPIFEFTSGYSNSEKQILNTIETKYNLGSANKMFTAVAIAQLVEKGCYHLTI